MTDSTSSNEMQVSWDGLESQVHDSGESSEPSVTLRLPGQESRPLMLPAGDFEREIDSSDSRVRHWLQDNFERDPGHGHLVPKERLVVADAASQTTPTHPMTLRPLPGRSGQPDQETQPTNDTPPS